MPIANTPIREPSHYNACGVTGVSFHAWIHLSGLVWPFLFLVSIIPLKPLIWVGSCWLPYMCQLITFLRCMQGDALNSDWRTSDGMRKLLELKTLRKKYRANKNHTWLPSKNAAKTCCLPL